MSSDDGFTLGELLVVLSIASVLLALSAGGFQSYRTKSEHRGSALELASTLRKAQVRAVAEARTYCVRIVDGGTTFTLYRGNCGSGVVQTTFETNSSQITFASPAFVTNGVTGPDVYLYPRGSASDGSVRVVRGSTEYTIEVEGLTARVSSNV